MKVHGFLYNLLGKLCRPNQHFVSVIARKFKFSNTYFTKNFLIMMQQLLKRKCHCVLYYQVLVYLHVSSDLNNIEESLPIKRLY